MIYFSFLKFLITLPLYALALRLMAEWSNTPLSNPIAKQLFNATEPFVRIFRIPLTSRYIFGFDLSGLFALFIYSCLFIIGLYYLVPILFTGETPQLVLSIDTALSIALAGLISVFSILFDLIVWSVFLYIIASFFGAVSVSAPAEIAFRIAQTALGPLQRVIPRVGFFDFTPLLLFFAIRIIERVFFIQVAGTMDIPYIFILGNI